MGGDYYAWNTLSSVLAWINCLPVLFSVKNSRADQRWVEYRPGQYGTQDRTIYGMLFFNGSGLRIAYKSWLNRHSLWDQPDRQPTPSERAPVEDETTL